MTRSAAVLMAAALVVLACGSDPSSPARTDVAGTYDLTQLRFDPQGVLPEVDLFARLGAENLPRLVLAPAGEAQLIFRDPATGLITTTTGSYSTPEEGARIDFGSDPAFRRVFLSRRMTFIHSESPGTLSFDAAAPEGVDRQRLLELVPEWADEQLLDPVPGRLIVVFTESS